MSWKMAIDLENPRKDVENWYVVVLEFFRENTCGLKQQSQSIFL